MESGSSPDPPYMACDIAGLAADGACAGQVRDYLPHGIVNRRPARITTRMRASPTDAILPIARYWPRYWQRTLSLSIARPASAPPPAPRMVPSVFDPPGAMMLPSTPPAIAPTMVPVDPSLRLQ